MAISEAIIRELEEEAKVTRRVLERILDEKLDWKPHEKSMTMRRLASHVADTLSWVKPALELDQMDIAPDYQPWLAPKGEELLQRFEANLQAAKEALDGYTDEKLMSSWTLSSGDKVYFSLPRLVVIRSFVMNHLVHHRGQLSVYLRLNDIPVPSIYGPSADEPGS